MPSRSIEEFAKRLVAEVRDEAIRECDSLLLPTSRSPVSERWRRVSEGPSGPPAREIIPDCVDRTLMLLLDAIDEGRLRLQFVDADGNVVDLVNEGHGEMMGWYGGSPSWRSMYSKERLVDYFGKSRQ